ncbi:hypothetical protein SAMN04487974_1253 [Pelagibacterium luteolum]|uniref:Uncharacterized protein n=2 Tax=Pelagibacterium luteolum TaxID=440168 RepID=A0A1G8A1U8_9HYPH|nr:hypothetical protein SAMN04487974_1253 [Pelagibacterium luteolum]
MKRKIDAAIASIIFAVIVTISILVLTAMLVVQGYNDQFERAETTAAADAHIVAVHTQWMVEASLQALERIKDSIALEGTWPQDRGLGNIDEQLSSLPNYMRISVYGPAEICDFPMTTRCARSMSPPNLFSAISSPAGTT